jgi:Icc-related predicted phosphoesterase
MIIFHPKAISTPIHKIEYNVLPRQEMAENVNRVSRNHVINVLNSTIKNEQHLLDMTPDESIDVDVLSSGIASKDLLSTLETTLREKTNIKKQKKTLQGENSIKENNDRLNRSNFFLKNIMTSMGYMDIFIAIGTMYPLVQLKTTENSSKIQYLCVAGNAFINTDNISRL